MSEAQYGYEVRLMSPEGYELPYRLYERTSPAGHSRYEANVVPVEGESLTGLWSTQG